MLFTIILLFGVTTMTTAKEKFDNNISNNSMINPTWKYLAAEGEFETGDILLFHHEKDFKTWAEVGISFFTKFLSIFTHSKYDHSAIIIKDPTFTDVPKGLYVLESSYEDFPDAENGQYKVGVELEHFDEMISNWPGQVYWRKLSCNRDATFYQKLAQAHQVVHDKPYDENIADWWRAEMETKSETQRNNSFFCSALVSYIYTKLGLLPADTPWSEISPDQLGTEPFSVTHRPKVVFQNCQVASEVQIK